jgi:BhlA holin family
MEILEYLKYFISTETPFMLLFVSLFFYTVKNNRDRELIYFREVENKLAAIEENMDVLIKVWKILLEKELEAKK